jgi:hypothetical protein
VDVLTGFCEDALVVGETDGATLGISLPTLILLGATLGTALVCVDGEALGATLLGIKVPLLGIIDEGATLVGVAVGVPINTLGAIVGNTVGASVIL